MREILLCKCGELVLKGLNRRSFEDKRSLSRMLMKTFGALLGTEDLTQTVAKAEALNGKLIDMLAAVQKQPTANTGGLKLAKKG